MNLTAEQQLAVDKKGTNIIVSAGAGSGKTFVLTTRVLNNLLDGKDINSFIILTFTNNAALNMKSRIRSKINQAGLTEQAWLIDQAYITTFDSFSGSLVKKYSYLLNIDKNYKIISEDVENTAIRDILTDIFDEYYKGDDKLFFKLIKDLTIKDDKIIINSITSLYKKLSSKPDMLEYLSEYISKHYNKNYINNLFNLYEDVVLQKKEYISCLLESLASETINEKALNINNVSIKAFNDATSYDEILNSVSFSLARNIKETYTDEGVILKDEIASELKKLKELVYRPKKTLIEEYLLTEDYVTIIIKIIFALDKRLKDFKKRHNSYTFNDIELKAIELVQNHKDICDKIKEKTYEIMIDEYQDTNDIQETFISYIENNNVYMVGDIKQSIYRFRNANPTIFKNKYDSYKNNINGFKIDMNKNFRSRKEVIDNINHIFNLIMFDDLGGAAYLKEHQMNFGMQSYEEHKKAQNYDMEILNYENTKNNIETESLIIANDILNRINSHEKVLDGNNLRDITFKDFAILIDKTKNFEEVKKILEENQIPVSLEKDISIRNEDEIYILKNLIQLLICLKANKLNNDFKHSFISIARSYLCNYSDEEIFDFVTNDSYCNTPIYKKLKKVSEKVDVLSNKEIILKLIEEFDIVNKLITVGDIDERLTKLEYFLNIAESLNDMGMDVHKMIDYFDNLEDNDEEIKMKLNVPNSNSVKITTIHKSKGLEYNYVYLPFLDSKIKSRNNSANLLNYHNEIGIITPFYLNSGKGETFAKSLYNYYENKEALDEKIRLFYVALTRAKEKILLITSFDESEMTYSINSLKNATSISNIMSIIKPKIQKYIRNVDVNNLNYQKNTNNYFEIPASNKKIEVNELNIENKIMASKHFSKPMTKIINKELKDRLDFGTYAHYIFETTDFKKPLDNEIVLNFLKHKEVEKINQAKIYKEHEIYFESDFKTHGFIDLLLEYDDHFDIIDYKLSNIDSIEYDKQLIGYKNYIENKYNKPTNIFLYSIRKDKFKKISKST